MHLGCVEVNMRARLVQTAGIGLITLAIDLLSVQAAIQTWNGGTGDWSEVSNWATAVPADGDDVVITNRGALVLLTNSTAWLSSLVISNASLACSNWNTTIYVTNLTILSSGILTCAGPFTNNAMSNRVNLTCTNLIVGTGGAINVQGRGFSGGINIATNYMVGHGPGGGVYEIVGTGGPFRSGGGYGGAGSYSSSSQLRNNSVYGSVTVPLDPGSGGTAGTYTNISYGGHGGGAVCVTAIQVVVNGSINADSLGPSSPNGVSTAYGSGGSGGGIYIRCSTITGTNGVISADGSACLNDSGGGGGGRIAVHYDPAAQSLLPAPSLRFSTAAGMGAPSYYNTADIGTLYFADNYFFSPTNLFNCQWMAPGLTNLALSEWTVSNVWVRLPLELSLKITNTLTVVGYNNYQCRLEITNDCALDCGNIQIRSASLALGVRTRLSKSVAFAAEGPSEAPFGPTLNCAGDLTLTNTGQLIVAAGLTNRGALAGYGARVTVGRSIVVYTNCWIYPIAHPTNGAAVLFSACNVNLNAGGGFNAEQLGYAGGLRSGGSNPYGPGSVPFNGGAGYGGAGSNGYYHAGGAVYGSSNAPVDPGSGAAAGRHSGSGNGPYGGGSVQIRATDVVTVKGAIKANGGPGVASYGPGASGGGIYIACRTFVGDSNGSLQASGGNWSGATNFGGGGGGGGRIAVWRIFDQSPTVISNYASGGLSWGGMANTNIAGPGTIVWGWTVPPAGTIVSTY